MLISCVFQVETLVEAGSEHGCEPLVVNPGLEPGSEHGSELPGSKPHGWNLGCEPPGCEPPGSKPKILKNKKYLAYQISN